MRFRAVSLVAALALGGCVAEPADEFAVGAPEAVAPHAPRAWSTARLPSRAAEGRADMHFTRPGTRPGEERDPEADDAVVAALDSARESVDMALYGFDHPAIVDAARRAVARGVRVRFVGDADESDDAGYRALAGAGAATVVRPEGDAIMHHKFVVVDGREVLTGSLNLTGRSVLLDNDHLLHLRSPGVASLYRHEFNELFAGRFGTDKRRSPRNAVRTGGRDVEVHFAPQDDPKGALRGVLRGARKQALFMTFSFTDADLASDLADLRARGVEVAGIFDEQQASGLASVDEALVRAGVPVWLDGNRNTRGYAGGKLHHKVLVVDPFGPDATVVTGSFNWSRAAAERNDENLVVLRGADFVAPFLEEFCGLLRTARRHPRAPGQAADVAACRRAEVRIAAVFPGERAVELTNAGRATADLSRFSLGDGLLAPGETRRVEDVELGAVAGEVALHDTRGLLADAVRYEHARAGVVFRRRADGTFRAETPGARVVINELLPDPDGTDRGREFVEILNAGTASADLGSWVLGDAFDPDRIVFPAGLQLAAGAALVVRDDGRDPLGVLPGQLSLNNDGDVITLRDRAGAIADQVSYTSARRGVSLVRQREGDPDAALVDHVSAPDATAPQSPGLRSSGRPF